MLLSYLTTAFRNLSRRPLYNGVNIFGLSLGLAIAVVTALYLHHELSYDHFHSKADKIYRISGKKSDSWFASLSTAYSNALYQNQFPEVEEITRIRKYPSRYIHYGNTAYYESKVLFTDSGSDFFRFFDFTPVQGSLKDALEAPNSVVLTESVATGIFGKENAIGKSLVFDSLQLIVTAVIEDLPSNTHLDFKVLITNDRAMEQASGHFTYGLLADNVDTEKLSKKILTVDVPSNEFSKLQECSIIPLTDLHFDGNMTFEMKPAGSKTYLLIFALIGSAILILSCFNFINLSIAVYTRRAKEIAIRKVVGASSRQLSLQFIIESLVFTLIGFPAILILTELILPWFSRFMDIELHNFFITNASGFLLLFVFTATIGLIAGAYPALVLPRVSSLSLFKSGKLTGIGSLNLRTLLVAVQVTIMTIMLSGSWILQTQMNFLSSKDLGFEKEGVIKLKGAWAVDSLQYTRIKSRLLENPAITAVSQGFAPGDEDYGFPFKGEGSDVVYSDLIAFGTDADYPKTLGLKILQLQEGYSLEKSSKIVLVNETLAKRLGYEDPVGQRIILSPGKKHESNRAINGVFSDFHFFSLHQTVTPMMLTLRPFSWSQNIMIKVNTADLTKTLGYIDSVVRDVTPNVPLTSEFLDDSLASLYQKEQKLSFFSTILLLLTLFLSVLGLVGLSSYMAELKTKEIGIRKILGASIRNILQLLSAPFVKLALVAFVVGSFTSYHLMRHWLESFAYRVSISWHFYLYTLAGLMALLLLTAGSHALKAALANPVKSLRSE